MLIFFLIITYLAFVHDRLFHIGWAEAVFFDIIQNYNKSVKKHKKNRASYTIYTLFSDKTHYEIHDMTLPIITALPRWLNALFVRWSGTPSKYLPIRMIQSIFDYRHLIVFYPLLCTLLRKKIQKNNPSRIIISSFAAAKNIVPPAHKEKSRASKVILYLHSPNQYIHENYNEYKHKIGWRKGKIFQRRVPHLRKRDMLPRHYDAIITNSSYTAQCAKTYYAKSTLWKQTIPCKKAAIKTHCSQETIASQIFSKQASYIHVCYPWLPQVFHITPPSSSVKDYFLYIGRLTSFVREVDKIIDLFNTTKQQLIIAWSWPDEAILQKRAWATIHFVGNITQTKAKIELIRHARWLINIAKESCGIASMEALSLGVPIFGYHGWATPEFVNHTNGVLVRNKSSQHLVDKFTVFSRKSFDRKEIKKVFLSKI